MHRRPIGRVEIRSEGVIVASDWTDALVRTDNGRERRVAFHALRPVRL